MNPFHTTPDESITLSEAKERGWLNNCSDLKQSQNNNAIIDYNEYGYYMLKKGKLILVKRNK